MRSSLSILLLASIGLGCPEEAGPCRTSLDCEQDEGCFEGLCLQLCERDDDCAAGERCRHGVCQINADTADAAARDRSAADAARPDIARPDAVAPDAVAPDAVAPDTGAVDAGSPDTTLADAAVMDAALPDTALPDVLLADTSVPDVAVPDVAVPDVALPDTAMPDVALPDTLEPDAGPTRAVDGLVVLYTFTEASGTVVHDVSGLLPPLDLHIEDPNSATWNDEGLRLAGAPSIVRSRVAATKVIDACTTSDAITIEAWVTPEAPFGHGPSRIATLSADAMNRNFTLGQGNSNGDDNFLLRIRTDQSGTTNGVPAVYTEDGPPTVVRTHVVVTHAAADAGYVHLYLDGTEVDVRLDDVAGWNLGQPRAGGYSNWDVSFQLALGHELSAQEYIRAWFGTYHLVAIYGRALSADEVQQNFLAGPR